MKWIKNNIRKEQGFTLVEIIVVLVVLAILAAFTIPTMLGFVADAKAKSYIAEAREVYVAAQAVATQYIGNDKSLDVSTNNTADAFNSYWVSGRNNTANPNKAASEQMKKYIGNDLKISGEDYRGNYLKDESYWFVIMNTQNKAKVDKVYYVKNNYIIWFSEGTVTVEKLIQTGNLRPNVPWNRIDSVPTSVY